MVSKKKWPKCKDLLLEDDQSLGEKNGKKYLGETTRAFEQRICGGVQGQEQRDLVVLLAVPNG